MQSRGRREHAVRRSLTIALKVREDWLAKREAPELDLEAALRFVLIETLITFHIPHSGTSGEQSRSDHTVDQHEVSTRSCGLLSTRISLGPDISASSR
jgi:hypothetical protein